MERNLKNILGEIDLICICGSGLTSISEIGSSLGSFSYNDLGINSYTLVEGHYNEAELKMYNNRRILFLKGRLHYYEGHSLNYLRNFLSDLYTFCNLRRICITNAAGGNFIETPRILLNISLLNQHPLILDRHLFSERELLDLCRINPSNILFNLFSESSREDPLWRTGIASCGLYGPTFETPSESIFNLSYETLSMGMSPSREVGIALLLGLEVTAITFCVASTPNFDPDFFDETTHIRVLQISQTLSSNFRSHLEKVISQL